MRNFVSDEGFRSEKVWNYPIDRELECVFVLKSDCLRFVRLRSSQTHE